MNIKSNGITKQPWKLVNLKVPEDALKRIDEEAQRLGLTRTTYMIARADPLPGPRRLA